MDGVFIGSTRGLNYSDAAVTANTTYTYTVKAEDFFTNEGAGVNKVATTTPNSLTQTGVRPLGSYWGGGGESIDMRSGNLNYTMGLLKAQSRHGLGMGFALSYNSQTWRNADGMTWNMGRDVGYGYGFKLLAGSIYPVFAGGSTIMYIYTDSSGAEYRLDVGSSGHWWSREGVYLHFDPGTQKLYFSDGSWWVMGATSWAPEQDAGTMYPTWVQDTNGNQIQIQYKPALGSATVNTSARLDWIWDARAGAYPNVTYLFTYGASGCNYADEVPHLTAIGTALPTSENYAFTYACQGTLASPFTAAGMGSAVALKTRTVVSGAPGANLTTTFDYGSNGSLELAKVTFPYGGTLRWDLGNIGSTQQVRGVNSRYLRMSTGATEYTYALTRDVAAGWARLDDADGKSRKRWEFETSTASAWYGLVKRQLQIARPALTTMRQMDVTWTWTGFGSPHIASQTTQIDPGQSYAKTMKSEQTLDLFGRLTVSKLYDFGNLSTPKWETGVTYLSGPNYDSRWILNRVTGTTLKFNGGAAIQYSQASYDGGTLTNRTGLSLWDPTYSVGMPYRGNVTSSGVPGFPQTTVAYDVTGMPVSVANGGTTTQVTSYDSKNVAPTMITTGSLSVSTQYNSVYEVTQTTGPNNATTSATYDSVARTSTETAATGAVVTYTYAQAAPQVTATVNGRWTKTHLDGLGRAVKVETGNGGTTLSTVEMVYEPCGCSPMGKVKQVSMPYAPGGTKYWTVYTYDAAGRTVKVAMPNSLWLKCGEQPENN